MKYQIKVNSAEETYDFAKKIAPELDGQTVLMNGNLGAGKTTFVKAVAEYYKCDEASSPTFTLMQHYKGNTNIFHFDLYRLKNIIELEQIGFFETIEDDGIKFVEWADLLNVKDTLEKYVEINIKHLGDNAREISVFEHYDTDF